MDPLYVKQDIGTCKPLLLLHGLFADGTQWQKPTHPATKKHHIRWCLFVAGEEGFEPPNAWTKTMCLTTWPLPIVDV